MADFLAMAAVTVTLFAALIYLDKSARERRAKHRSEDELADLAGLNGDLRAREAMQRLARDVAG